MPQDVRCRGQEGAEQAQLCGFIKGLSNSLRCQVLKIMSDV